MSVVNSGPMDGDNHVAWWPKEVSLPQGAELVLNGDDVDGTRKVRVPGWARMNSDGKCQCRICAEAMRDAHVLYQVRSMAWSDFLKLHGYVWQAVLDARPRSSHQIPTFEPAGTAKTN